MSVLVKMDLIINQIRVKKDSFFNCNSISGTTLEPCISTETKEWLSGLTIACTFSSIAALSAGVREITMRSKEERESIMCYFRTEKNTCQQSFI